MRIAGVNVGKVVKVERMDGDSDMVKVTMEMKDEGLPIHKDATAKIRSRIFLEGNFFVELSPGTPNARRARRRRHDPGHARRRRRCSSTSS